MILHDNYFVKHVLPARVLRTLSVEEMAEYRRPIAEPGEGQLPTLTWPREIPIEGEPADVAPIVAGAQTLRFVELAFSARHQS